MNCNYFRYNRRTCSRNQKGVSMIEILVTLVISVVGLMGMVTLQLVGLKNTNSSHHQYQVTLLAYDLQERMRANEPAVVAGLYTGTVTHETSEYTDEATNSEAIAEQDTKDWAQGMRNAGIPSFSGVVAANGNIYNITVTWAEQNPAVVGGDPQEKTFNLAVRL